MAFTLPLERLLKLLENVRASGNGSTARCPAHDDRENSLSVNIGDDGRVLLKCFAGCTVEAVVDALGLELRDLFPKDGSSSTTPNEPVPPITVGDLAQDKRLPVEFLASLKLEDRGDGVVVPYSNLDGSLASRHRLRTALRAKDGSLWLFGDGKTVGETGLVRPRNRVHGGRILQQRNG